jgi:hypothetical protein
MNDSGRILTIYKGLELARLTALIPRRQAKHDPHLGIEPPQFTIGSQALV